MTGSVPFFWSSRKGWFLKVKQDGKYRNVFLADNKKKAFELFRAMTATTCGKSKPFIEVGEAWLAFQLRRQKQGEVSLGWLKRINRTITEFGKANPGILATDVTPVVAGSWLPDDSKPGYARTELATLRQCLRWAFENDLIDRNPLKALRLPKNSSRDSTITLSQHRQLCRNANRQFKMLLRFAWLTGCRPVELRSLKWSDISKDLSIAVLENHKTRGKTDKPRVIYFPEQARSLLKSMRRRKRSGYVFRNTHGDPWTKDSIVCAMRRLRKRAKLSDVVTYSYRHTFVTRALLSGIDIATVAELAGHSSTDMVSRVYGHLNKHKEHLSKAVDKIQ